MLIVELTLRIPPNKISQLLLIYIEQTYLNGTISRWQNHPNLINHSKVKFILELGCPSQLASSPTDLHCFGELLQVFLLI